MVGVPMPNPSSSDNGDFIPPLPPSKLDIILVVIGRIVAGCISGAIAGSLIGILVAKTLDGICPVNADVCLPAVGSGIIVAGVVSVVGGIIGLVCAIRYIAEVARR
jgi:uncharacterized membrane protein